MVFTCAINVEAPSRRFVNAARCRVYIFGYRPKRLEPRQTGRQLEQQLEQQRQQLSFSEPQQQQPVEHEQQYRLSPLQLIASPDRGRLRMSVPRTGDDPAGILFRYVRTNNGAVRGAW